MGARSPVRHPAGGRGRRCSGGADTALTYRSWQDFSAGYILGRCLHFDEEDFGSWYTDMVDAHRILMSDPGSPWLNIPFR
ncbi:DUF1266 domain-containing protein [Streptomyces flaveolus]|uniref:DUF1266 domain-containing protein n=1 Tax=Streptomyces flaveolus TaxID=67297 RepID=UPI003F4CF4EE